VQQIKLVTRQLLGPGKCSLSYRIVQPQPRIIAMATRDADRVVTVIDDIAHSASTIISH